MFKSEIEKEVNSKVTIASAGMNIEFNKRIF